ncbi:hypothetical protein ONE63_007658 [Megalurothrips usitatus]|uniref:Uncharacterized protein n=1 Tax=Megalurothrips usitatus TaxID=439358 RepID=A0AAV7XPF5_9NEOP|nr:hypothetical protein ONE63_007658 [Megalurothrips usitatus]
MNLRATSNVHILTGKKPVTKVQKHSSKTLENTKEQCLSSLSQTNRYLKKGGSLPSVLPSGNESASSLNSRNGRGFSERRMSVSHNKQTQVPNVKEPHAQPQLDTCLLEKKMENLSCKLSKVQDILLNQIVDSIESPACVSDKNNMFSAQDYTLLVLEMNGNVPAHPYDPLELSEINLNTERTTNWTSASANGRNVPDDDRTNTLLSIQDELSNWRAEQRMSDGDHICT